MTDTTTQVAIGIMAIGKPPGPINLPTLLFHYDVATQVSVLVSKRFGPEPASFTSVLVSTYSSRPARADYTHY